MGQQMTLEVQLKYTNWKNTAILKTKLLDAERTVGVYPVVAPRVNSLRADEILDPVL